MFLIRSVMIFVNTAFEISRLTEKKAGISGKSQLFPENCLRKDSNDSFNEVTRNF